MEISLCLTYSSETFCHVRPTVVYTGDQIIFENQNLFLLGL